MPLLIVLESQEDQNSYRRGNNEEPSKPTFSQSQLANSEVQNDDNTKQIDDDGMVLLFDFIESDQLNEQEIDNKEDDHNEIEENQNNIIDDDKNLIDQEVNDSAPNNEEINSNLYCFDYKNVKYIDLLFKILLNYLNLK